MAKVTTLARAISGFGIAGRAVLRRTSSFAATAIFLAGVAHAHGGMFRGPVPGVTGGPSGPGGAGSPGARTGSLGEIGGPTSWMSWWEFNKDPYLRLRDAIHDPGVLGTMSDGQTGVGVDTLAPTAATRRDQILPALRALLEANPNRDVQTACLIAMAKIGVDHPDFELLPILRERLSRGNQEIRETAAVALGITRRLDAIDDLLALALDTGAGRKLVGVADVDSRTRSFAIYGLGLIADRHTDLGVQRRLAEAVSKLLDVDDRDIRVAAIQCLGSLRSHPESAGNRRLQWEVLATLWQFFGRDLGRGDELVQAHVPTAVARLIGRGNSGEHALAKRKLAEAIDARTRSKNEVVQSAVLALGKLLAPEELEPADAEYAKLLREHADEGKDELSRYFALMALAEVGGEANREFLLRAFHQGGKGTDKPWAALGLGVLGFHAREAAGGAVDTTIGQVLQQGFRDAKVDELQSAIAIGLGLVGYRDSIRDLERELGSRQLRQFRQLLRGYLAIGLALMDATQAIPQLRAVLVESDRQPLLLMQTAIALGRLGDKEAIPLLTDIMRDGDENVVRLSGLASAFRYIGDRRAVDGLLDLLADRDLSKLARAFVAAALGGVADDDALPWNSLYSIGTNYRATTGTLTDGGTGILDIL